MAATFNGLNSLVVAGLSTSQVHNEIMSRVHVDWLEVETLSLCDKERSPELCLKDRSLDF